MRLSCKDVCENALQTAIHCTNINCSRCCCCLQWERWNGAEERKQWLREESLRPGRRKAGKGERPEKWWWSGGRFFSSLDTEQWRRTALSCRGAWGSPELESSRCRSTDTKFQGGPRPPRGRASDHQNWKQQAKGSSSVPITGLAQLPGTHINNGLKCRPLILFPDNFIESQRYWQSEP